MLPDTYALVQRVLRRLLPAGPDRCRPAGRRDYERPFEQGRRAGLDDHADHGVHDRRASTTTHGHCISPTIARPLGPDGTLRRCRLPGRTRDGGRDHGRLQIMARWCSMKTAFGTGRRGVEGPLERRRAIAARRGEGIKRGLTRRASFPTTRPSPATRLMAWKPKSSWDRDEEFCGTPAEVRAPEPETRPSARSAQALTGLRPVVNRAALEVTRSGSGLPLKNDRSLLVPVLPEENYFYRDIARTPSRSPVRRAVCTDGWWDGTGDETIVRVQSRGFTMEEDPASR